MPVYSNERIEMRTRVPRFRESWFCKSPTSPGLYGETYEEITVCILATHSKALHCNMSFIHAIGSNHTRTNFKNLKISLASENPEQDLPLDAMHGHP